MRRMNFNLIDKINHYATIRAEKLFKRLGGKLDYSFHDAIIVSDINLYNKCMHKSIDKECKKNIKKEEIDDKRRIKTKSII